MKKNFALPALCLLLAVFMTSCEAFVICGPMGEIPRTLKEQLQAKIYKVLSVKQSKE